LLAQDASELYAKTVAALLALMLKDNIMTLNWDDAVLTETVLTHEGKPRSGKTEHDAFPNNAAQKVAEHPVKAA
jgi:NAD(P) transhydrogenase subunit alpha